MNLDTDFMLIKVNGINGVPPTCAKVSPEDYPLVSRWSWQLGKPRNGYARRTIWRGAGKWGTLYMHRLILGLSTDMEVDHINGDRLDNRRSNLRLVTRSENMHNVHNPRPNKTHYRNVEVHGSRFTARVKLNGIRTYLGCYRTPQEAHEAAVRWKRIHIEPIGPHRLLSSLSRLADRPMRGYAHARAKLEKGACLYACARRTL